MRNVCGCRHLCIFEIFCELLQPFREGLANGRPSVDSHPSLNYCCEFSVNRASFLLPDRHFALLRFLDLLRVSISSELKTLLLSMCIDAPESTVNSRSSDFFSSPMLLCGRIFPVARFLGVTCPQNLAHTDCVLEVHTFE